jgi:hypothetical protein
MYPLNGMTFSHNFVNISEVVPALTWIQTRPLQCVFRICVAETLIPGWKMA